MENYANMSGLGVSEPRSNLTQGKETFHNLSLHALRSPHGPNPYQRSIVPGTQGGMAHTYWRLAVLRCSSLSGFLDLEPRTS